VDGTRGEGTRRRAACRAIDRLWPEKESERRFAVLTGGEPALQVDRPFIDGLHARGLSQRIETNGTLGAAARDRLGPASVQGRCALKLASGKRAEARLSAGGRLALGLEDSRSSIPAQPVDGPNVRPRNTARRRPTAWSIRSGALSLQTHKFLGIQVGGRVEIYRSLRSTRPTAFPGSRRPPLSRAHGHSFVARIVLAGSRRSGDGIRR